jgi:hypothetical protein
MYEKWPPEIFFINCGRMRNVYFQILNRLIGINSKCNFVLGYNALVDPSYLPTSRNL